ncbi:MAG: adenylyltransferase/cytidyltransferase family protein [archaeon]
MTRVLCCGTFDVLHDGHIEFFKDIKSQGDELIVMIVPDEVVCRNKGRAPANKQSVRADNIGKIDIVNEVVVVRECFAKNPEFVKSLKPNVIALGYDQESPVIDNLRKELKGVKFYRSKEFAGGIHSRDLRGGD